MRCPRRLLLWTREEVRVWTGQVLGTERGKPCDIGLETGEGRGEGLAQSRRLRGAVVVGLEVPIQTDRSQRTGSSPARRGRVSLSPRSLHLEEGRARHLGQVESGERAPVLRCSSARGVGACRRPWSTASPGRAEASDGGSECISRDFGIFHGHLMGRRAVLPGQRSWEGWALLVGIPRALAEAGGSGAWVLATDPPSFLRACVAQADTSAQGLPHCRL